MADDKLFIPGKQKACPFGPRIPEMVDNGLGRATMTGRLNPTGCMGELCAIHDQCQGDRNLASLHKRIDSLEKSINDNVAGFKTWLGGIVDKIKGLGSLASFLK